MTNYTLIKISEKELEAKIIELLEETQGVDMFQGHKKWICISDEGELYISDWWSQGTSIEGGVMIYGLEATEDFDSDENEYDSQFFHFPKVYENLKECNRINFELI